MLMTLRVLRSSYPMCALANMRRIVRLTGEVRLAAFAEAGGEPLRKARHEDAAL